MAKSMRPDYHKFSETQAVAARKISSLVPSFVDQLSWLQNEEGPLVLVDYGCADGANSQIPIRDILKKVFEIRGKKIPVHVIHNDLPSSNFSFLFSLVENSQHSYKQEFGKGSQIYCFANGSSFYNQILGDDSVSLAFSSTAFHWLKQRPFPLQHDTLFHVEAPEEENKRWVKASLESLKEIFELRIKELRTGGRLLVSHISYQPDKPTPSSQILRIVDKVLFEELVDRDHKLTREQARACSNPQGFLSVPEVLSIFPEGQFFPENSKSGFRLISHETNQGYDPYFEQYEHGILSLEEYSQNLTKWLRAWFEVAFKTGLPDTVDKEDITNSLFSRVKEEISKDPKGSKSDILHLYLILEKIVKA